MKRFCFVWQERNMFYFVWQEWNIFYFVWQEWNIFTLLDKNETFLLCLTRMKHFLLCLTRMKHFLLCLTRMKHFYFKPLFSMKFTFNCFKHFMELCVKEIYSWGLYKLFKCPDDSVYCVNEQFYFVIFFNWNCLFAE